MSALGEDTRPGNKGGRFSGGRGKISILIVAMLVSLLFGEAVVRLWFRADFDAKRIHEINDDPNYAEGFAGPAADPERVFELKTGQLATWGAVVIATDGKEPRRISSFAPPPKDPAVRVALVGDSSAFGFGMYYDSAYGALLEVLLTASFEVPVEVRIYGMVGYNSRMIRSVVENEVAQWNPDLLILHYDHNDPDPPVSGGVITALHEDYGDNFLHSALVKFVIRRVRMNYMRARHQRIQRMDDASRVMVGPFRSKGTLYDGHLEEIQRIGEFAGGLKMPVMAVIFDGVITRFDDPNEDPHFTELHVGLLETFGKAGIVALDLYSKYQMQMRDLRWEDLERFAINGADATHPNEEGQAFIAFHVSEFIANDPYLGAPFRRPENRRMTEEDLRRMAAISSFQNARRLTIIGRYTEAEAYLREALQFNPNDPSLLLSLAQILVEQRRFSEAIVEVDRCLSLGKTFTHAHLILALCYREMGDLANALAHSERHLAESVNVSGIKRTSKMSVEMYVELAKETKSKDRDRAVEMIDRAIEISEGYFEGEGVRELEVLRAATAAGE